MTDKEQAMSEALDRIHELALQAKRLKEREDFRLELDKIAHIARFKMDVSKTEAADERQSQDTRSRLRKGDH